MRSDQIHDLCTQTHENVYITISDIYRLSQTKETTLRSSSNYGYQVILGF